VKTIRGNHAVKKKKKERLVEKDKKKKTAFSLGFEKE
jgi:hypothetical protein